MADPGLSFRRFCGRSPFTGVALGVCLVGTQLRCLNEVLTQPGEKTSLPPVLLSAPPWRQRVLTTTTAGVQVVEEAESDGGGRRATVSPSPAALLPALLVPEALVELRPPSWPPGWDCQDTGEQSTALHLGASAPGRTPNPG